MALDSFLSCWSENSSAEYLQGGGNFNGTAENAGTPDSRDDAPGRMLLALYSRSAILVNLANNNTQNLSLISDHDLRTVAMSMKEAVVVIVGAGSAGLILALSFIKYKIHVSVSFRH